MNYQEMMGDGRIFHLDYVPSFTSRGDVDIAHLLSVMQVAATEQCEAFGLGKEFREKMNASFVVLRSKIVFEKDLPKDKKLVFFTYPSKCTALQLYRYAFVGDEEGNIYISISTLWVMINIHTRCIMMTREFQKKLNETGYVFSAFPEYGTVSERLDNMPIDSESLKEVGFYDVAKTEIDGNGHMNNTFYYSIVQSYAREKIKVLELDFEKELFEGDKVRIMKATAEDSEEICGYRQDELSFKSKIIFR